MTNDKATNVVNGEKKKLDKLEKKNVREQEAKCRQEVIQKFYDMEIEDIRCGIGHCIPKGWFQKLAREEVYLVVYCLVGLSIGAYFTYSVSIISTIEKRFKITSKMTGLMLSGNDISQVLLSVFISYFGNYGNRAKLLGTGVLAASLSCFISALPHVIYGHGPDVDYIIQSLATNSTPLMPSVGGQTNKKEDFCYHPYQDSCNEEPVEYIGPILILFCAQFCMGITITVFYSIGLAYLDDNVDKKDSAVYYSVSMIIRLVGPVTGYFLGSRCLAIFINPNYKPNMSLRDPRWMGAWWLGYYFLTVSLFCLGFLILLFPRILPGTYYRKLKGIYKKETGPDAETFCAAIDLKPYVDIAKKREKHAKPTLTKLPQALKRLLTNKVYMGYLLNTALALLALSGYWNFKPKYLEFQFRKSASEANLFTGLSGLVASVFGLGISGLIIKVLKPGAKAIAAYAIFLTIAGSAAMLGLMSIGCPKLQIQGSISWNDNYGLCNVDCGCTDRYSPVCSEDGTTVFYSSCYAGCKEIDNTASPVQYNDCECIKSKNPSSSLEYQPLNGTVLAAENISLITTESRQGSATQGYCTENCDAFSKYLILTAVNSMIGATGRIGGTLILIRSVDEQDKGLALGMLTVCLSLFSFIPAPILMGAIVDYSCIIWDNTCGKIGNCWLYDSDMFRILIHSVPSALLLISLVGDIIVYIYCDDVKLYGEDEEDEEKGTVKNSSSEAVSLELKDEKKQLFALQDKSQPTIKTNNPD